MQQSRLTGFTAEEHITCQLPDQVVLLGTVLLPVSVNLHQALQSNGRLSVATDLDGVSDPSEHLSAVAVAMEQLGNWIEELRTTVLQNDRATPMEVCCVAGRLEQLLRPLMDHYLKLRSNQSETEALDELSALLLSAHRHILTEISEWLDRLVRIVQGPLAELRRQHLSVKDNVVIPVELNLTTPPAYARMHELLVAMSTGPTDDECGKLASQPSSPGFWDKVGAAVFGLGLAGAIWRKGA